MSILLSDALLELPPGVSREVSGLVSDLGLVQVGSFEYHSWLRVLSLSHYSRYWFCERWRAAMDEKRCKRNILQRELYKRNKPYSRYVYASLGDQ